MANSTINKHEEQSDSENAVVDLPLRRAPAAASTTTRPPTDDPVFGANQLGTGLTTEDTQNKLEEAGARSSWTLQEAEELQGLQIEWKEKASDIEASLKEIRKEKTHLQEALIQKQSLLAHYNAEIERRAKQIEEYVASITRLGAEVAKLEADEKVWARRLQDQAEREDELVALAYLYSEPVGNEMTSMSDDDFQNLMQRVDSRAAKCRLLRVQRGR
ncbi:hypothetical protein A1O7_08168 [Cladophialophora yegresii CBS 114405]|uniref:Uncharacterized protein n=1 Tax=Cladophialophora yegresii CBS 114405 TaxID=1182544 RepID=W9VHW5_9EURO|nr:uncharacterized protein A1O7_08168 [Cladophialophora yegresii CBS 114405]EXJ55242.1 hypothetical protein A1O7_08168 [Cladophialophora yegresii CBS 114405]